MDNNSKIDAYLALDLSMLRENISQNLIDEQQGKTIVLTSKYGSDAPGSAFTPAMKDCFNRHVAPVRRAALSEVSSITRRIDAAGGGEVKLREIGLDEAHQRHQQRLAEVHNRFDRQNGHLMTAAKQAEEQYQRHKDAEGRREAKTPSPWLEYGFMLPLVLIPEALMNFESFRQAPLIKSDLMATGITLLVAIGIAVAAHYFGLYLRQFNHNYRGDDRGRAHSAWPALLIANVILLVCLGVVAAARYYLVLEQIQTAVIMGHTPPNLLMQLLSLLMGNLLCFFLGAGLTFALHDRNPEYEDAARSAHKYRKSVAKARRKMFDPEVKQLDARLQSDRDALDRACTTVQRNDGYSEALAQFERIRAKDDEVIAELQHYLKQLASGLAAAPHYLRSMVKQHDKLGDPTRSTMILPPEELGGCTIELRYI